MSIWGGVASRESCGGQMAGSRSRGSQIITREYLRYYRATGFSCVMAWWWWFSQPRRVRGGQSRQWRIERSEARGSIVGSGEYDRVSSGDRLKNALAQLLPLSPSLFFFPTLSPVLVKNRGHHCPFACSSDSRCRRLRCGAPLAHRQCDNIFIHPGGSSA